jgi:hypothetical protein
MPSPTIEALCSEAAIFSAAESHHPEPLLYGITDGKAVGTYLVQEGGNTLTVLQAKSLAEQSC